MTADPAEIAAAAAKAVAVALEELAFMPVDSVPSAERSSLETPCKWAKVEASGGDGTVQSFAVIIPESLLAQVATTVLGVSEDEVGQAVLRDTVAELANMGCGSLMRTLAGDSTFSLGLPVVGDGEGPSEFDGAGMLREQLEVNGTRMDMIIERR